MQGQKSVDMSAEQLVKLLNPEVEEFKNENLNDNDKVMFTTPEGYIYEIQWVWVDLETTAIVGNRRIAVCLRDAAGTTIYQQGDPRLTPASNHYYFKFSCCETVISADADDIYSTPIVRARLPAEFSLRVYDMYNKDSNDDMKVYVMVNKYKIV